MYYRCLVRNVVGLFNIARLRYAYSVFFDVLRDDDGGVVDSLASFRFLYPTNAAPGIFQGFCMETRISQNALPMFCTNIRWSLMISAL